MRSQWRFDGFCLPERTATYVPTDSASRHRSCLRSILRRHLLWYVGSHEMVLCSKVKPCVYQFAQWFFKGKTEKGRGRECCTNCSYPAVKLQQCRTLLSNLLHEGWKRVKAYELQTVPLILTGSLGRFGPLVRYSRIRMQCILSRHAGRPLHAGMDLKSIFCERPLAALCASFASYRPLHLRLRLALIAKITKSRNYESRPQTQT